MDFIPVRLWQVEKRNRTLVRKGSASLVVLHPDFAFSHLVAFGQYLSLCTESFVKMKLHPQKQANLTEDQQERKGILLLPSCWQSLRTKSVFSKLQART